MFPHSTLTFIELMMNLFLSGAFYAWMVRTKCVDAVNAVYPDGDGIWQDDPATIHRTKDALAACSAFPQRIPHEKQAAKCSDIWPIEQVRTLFLRSLHISCNYSFSRSGESSNTKLRDLNQRLRLS